MIRATLFLALAAGLAAMPAAADDEFLSPPAADALRAGRQAAFEAKLRPQATAKAVTVEEVGDADSFGRNVHWMGLLSGYMVLQYADVRSAYPAAMTGRAMAVFTMALFLGVALMQWVTGLAASLAAARGADPYVAVMLTIAGMLATGAVAFRCLPAPAPAH